jgi:predicted Rossmann fold flavoprotein
MSYGYKGIKLIIDLKPALSEEKLDNRIQRDFEKYTKKQFKNSLDELLPQKLIPVIIRLSGISPEKPVNQITREERRALVKLLKGLTVTIKGARPIEEAIVTSGGINTDEINPSTLESKLVKGLFIAGEVIDIDGYTGGFNLTIAFSTGYMAGSSCY